MNDNYVLKWVNEAFTNEIEQLKFQISVLEEEVRLMKMERNQERIESDLMERNQKKEEIKMVIVFNCGCLITMVIGMMCL